MQFVTLRNAIKGVACAQTAVPFRNAIKILFTKICVHLRKFIVLSAVAALVVSLLWWQNGDGSRKKRARSLARKWKRRQSVNATTMLWSPRWERWVRERPAAPSIANKACGCLEKPPYPCVLCGAKPHSHPQNSFNVVPTLSPPHTFHTSYGPTVSKARATPTN